MTADSETPRSNTPSNDRNESADRTQTPRTRAPTPASGLGRVGWVLLGAIATALLGLPAALLLLPASQGVLEAVGLTLQDAYLVVPLVGALLFGLVGVWAALRTRRSTEDVDS